MTTVSARGRGPPGVAGVPSRKSFPYVSSAAGHGVTSIFTSGAEGPTTTIVPSTLPVGPVYAGRCSGLTTESTSSFGIGDRTSSAPASTVTTLADGTGVAPDGRSWREHPALPTKVAVAPAQARAR